MTNKITVAHVIRVFSYGGAEVLLREFFTSKGFQENIISDLFVLDHKKLGLVDQVQPFIRNFYYFKITSVLFPVQYIKFLYLLKKSKYNIVHMHLPVAGWLTIIAKLFCGKTKFVYSEHNLVTYYAKYNYYLSGLTYSLFDCVIFVSEEVKEVIKKVNKGWFFKARHPVVILNGIDTDKFTSVHRVQKNGNGTLVVGLIARFRPQKRVDKWVQVAEQIRKRTDKITFLMVGDGPEEGKLKQMVKEKQLVDVIKIPGQLTDTFSAYRKIDIFLLTSDFEGLPLALMEAMSCGCVPVVSNVGGIRQLEFTDFGYKFEDFNAVTIANKIVSYLDHPDEFSRQSKKARNFVESNYSLHTQVNHIIKLYNNLLHF
jgi:glycosyltransferase involved in cell wall biosynthesis